LLDTQRGSFANLLLLALRLHPPVPINMRFAERDTTIPRGGGADGNAPVFVSKGAAVHYSVWAMHRLPSIYGPDAEAFRPSRWLDDGLRPGWGYLPFNGGPRVCLGQQSALIDASYVVVRLVQHFGRIEARGGVFRESIALTLSHADGVEVALWKRV
jgi:cytochrome P450